MTAFTPKQWFHAPFTSDSSPIIIGGCGRSGTTLLRVILDTHSQITCGPESNLFIQPSEIFPDGQQYLSSMFDISPPIITQLLDSSNSHAQFIDKFFAHYQKINHKQIWAEKTPRNVYAFNYILKHFPQARLIHVIRDGRDVVCSLRHHMSHQVIDGKIVHKPRTNPLNQCILRWNKDTSQGLKFRHHPNYYEIRYEHLIKHPQATLTKLLAHLGLAWEPQLLNFFTVTTPSRDPLKMPQNQNSTKPIFSTSVGRWQKDLTPKQLQTVLHHTRPLLTQLGYIE